MSRRVERLIWVKLPTGYAAVGSSLARTRIRPPHSIDRQSLRARIGNLLYLSILAAYTVRSEYACNISPFPRKRLPRKVQAEPFSSNYRVSRVCEDSSICLFGGSTIRLLKQATLLTRDPNDTILGVMTYCTAFQMLAHPEETFSALR